MVMERSPWKKPNVLGGKRFWRSPTNGNAMKILFLHGWHSVPGGVKPSYLKSHGLEVINPKLDDDDFAAAIQTAQAAYDLHQPDVVVGSSRGGAVAMNIDSRHSKLILLCPAWKRWGTAKSTKAGTIILHSPADEVIPFENSVELAQISQSSLIEVGVDHRLADPESLSVLLWACQIAASGAEVPSLDEDLVQNTRPRANIGEEATYICDACGEEIVVPLDLTEGSQQSYVEDCPVCCRANIIHVHVDQEGNAIVYAEPEQDN